MRNALRCQRRLSCIRERKFKNHLGPKPLLVVQTSLYKPKHLNPVNIPPISKAVLLREHHDAEYDKIMGAQNMSSVEQRQGNSGMLVYLGFTPVSYDMRSCGQQRRDFMQRQVTQSVQICSLSSRVMIGQRLQK